MRHCINWLIKPFKQNIHIFISVFILSSIVDAYGFSVNESIPKAVFILMHHYIIAYILVLLYGFENIIYKKCYITIMYLLLIVNFIIDFTCNFVFHGTFGIDTAGIIMGTNLDEIQEFLQTFFSPILIFYISSSLLFLYFLSRQISSFFKKNSPADWITALLLCLLVLFYATLNVIHTSNWGNVSVTKFYKLANFVQLPDLRDFQKNVNLDKRTDYTAFDIVLIVGESFCRNHSSLYGYDKPTNPLLSTLYQDSLLYVFDNVEAPATNTIPAFKSIMSTYRDSYNDSVLWYKCETLINVFKHIGYKTFWLSNQSQKGAFDNVPTKYSELCDSVIFVGNRFNGICKSDYDELLLSPIRNLASIRDEESLNMYIVHMMGNHHNFTSRYPKEFEYFRVDDYLDKEEFQRGDFAAYDNSVRYNDSIVYEIMKTFNEETIVIYFPDHAIDLYETDCEYLGHARANDVMSQKVGKSIPFFIYTNELFKKRYPVIVKKIENSLNNSFNTENIIYSLMDLVGVTFRDNNDVERWSIFN